jgi:hypothetical protein
MTVDDLLSNMSSREFSEWMAYYSIEPFGEDRIDIAAGLIASTLANIHRDPKQRQKPYSVEEFCADYWKEPVVVPDEARLTPEEMADMMKKLRAARPKPGDIVISNEPIRK